MKCLMYGETKSEEQTMRNSNDPRVPNPKIFTHKSVTPPFHARQIFNFDTVAVSAIRKNETLNYHLPHPLLAILTGTSSACKTDNKVSERILTLCMSPPQEHPKQQSHHLFARPLHRMPFRTLKARKRRSDPRPSKPVK